jgi:hypothetical protein
MNRVAAGVEREAERGFQRLRQRRKSAYSLKLGKIAKAKLNRV